MMIKNLFLCITMAFGTLAFSQSSNAVSKKDVLKTERFARPVNTGANHTLLILDKSWPQLPEIGDEIAVYDHANNLVGAVCFQTGHNGIAIFGDDELTKEKEGMTRGESFKIVLWKKVTDSLHAYEMKAFEAGNEFYIKDGLTVVAEMNKLESIDSSVELFQNVPNPVKEHTQISFYLPEASKVQLKLYDTLGQEVKVLAEGNFEFGFHKIEMPRDSVHSGMYIYSLTVGDKTISKQMTLIN